MLGISYGEWFVIIGAAAAMVGPKDLPRIARTAGRLAGRSIGYVQMARGQLDSVMQPSQACQVHKELQDTMVQLDAIRHEIRSLSMLNPGPMTKTLMEKTLDSSREPDATCEVSEKLDEDVCQRPRRVLVLNHQLQPILSAKQQLMQNWQKLLSRQRRILKVNMINNMMTLAFYPCFQPHQKVLDYYQNIKGVCMAHTFYLRQLLKLR